MLGTPVNLQVTAEVEAGREKPTPVGTPVAVVVVVVVGGIRAAFLSTVKDLKLEFGGKIPRPLFHRDASDPPKPPSQHTLVSELVGTVSQGSPTSTSPAPVGTVMEGRGRV